MGTRGDTLGVGTRGGTVKVGTGTRGGTVVYAQKYQGYIVDYMSLVHRLVDNSRM